MKNTKELLATSVAEAVEHVKESMNEELTGAFLMDPLFAYNVASLAETNLFMLVGLSDKVFTQSLQTLLQVAFETGRVYGRAEIVNETVDRMEGKD